MKARDEELFDEQEIEDALAGLRPDADAFAAAVEEKVAAARAERRPDAVDAEPVERRGWPSWLKRAASVLPPGVVDSAVLGKVATGGGAKAASGSALLGPAALLALAVVGVVGAFGATSRLDASARIGQRARAVKVGSPIFILSILGVGVLALALLSSPLVTSRILGSALIVLLVAAARVLSAAGVAHRERMARTCVEILVQAMLLICIAADFDAPTAASVVTLGLFLGGMVTVALLVPRGSGRRAATIVQCVIVLLVVVSASFLKHRVYGAPFGVDQDAVVTWANGVDAPSTDLSNWELLGDAALCLEPGALARVDRARLRASFEGVPDQPRAHLHPTVATGALRIGVLPAEHLDDQASWFQRGKLRIYPSSRIGDRPLDFDVAVLRREGRYDVDARRALIELVERSWPEPSTFGCVGQALDCVRAAEVLEAGELLARFGERAPAVLASAWVGRRASSSTPVGFEPCLSDPGSARVSSDTEATLDAVLLMRRYGVPSSVDLDQLDRYLTRQMLSPDHVAPHPYRVEAALARLVLRRDLGLPPRGLMQVVAREPMPLFALFGVLLAVWIVWRAPRLASFEAGPLAE